MERVKKRGNKFFSLFCITWDALEIVKEVVVEPKDGNERNEDARHANVSNVAGHAKADAANLGLIIF